jgi:hypothetical protein
MPGFILLPESSCDLCRKLSLIARDTRFKEVADSATERGCVT